MSSSQNSQKQYGYGGGSSYGDLSIGLKQAVINILIDPPQQLRKVTNGRPARLPTGLPIPSPVVMQGHPPKEMILT